MSKKIIRYGCEYDLTNEITEFYKDLGFANFRGLTPKKVIELKNEAIKLNKKYNSKGYHMQKSLRYTKLMNQIRCTPKLFNIESPIEKFLLFMFSVDPTFEAAIIFGESNNLKEAKEKLREYFSLYDPYLVRIEQIYIKHFISQKKQEEIKEEIERRVFK